MKDGKRHTNHNAVSHGILATIVLTGPAFAEAREDLDRLISVISESIKPVDGLEQALVEKLAVLLLRLTRVYKADRAIVPKLFARVKDGLDQVRPPPKLHLIDREAQILIDRKDPSFEILMRYETAIERQIARTLDQIQMLRLLRESDGNARAQKLEGDHAKHHRPLNRSGSLTSEFSSFANKSGRSLTQSQSGRRSQPSISTTSRESLSTMTSLIARLTIH